VMPVHPEEAAVLAQCQDYQPYRDLLASTGKDYGSNVSVYTLGSVSVYLDGPSIFWVCAAGQIGEAEKLLR